MIDFRSLDRETRTVALVGRFLQLWGIMESAIDDAISKSLGLSTVQRFILAKNVHFMNKMHILRTLVDVSILSREAERFDKLVGQIQNLTGIRNMMAHDPFILSEKTDGVIFFVVRAKGRFAAPEEDWTISRFESEYTRLIGYTAELTELRDKLAKVTPTSSLALLLSGATPPALPTEESLGLGSLGRLIPQPPTDRTSDTTSSTPEKDPETPAPPE
jgi:hypothetical protein